MSIEELFLSFFANTIQTYIFLNGFFYLFLMLAGVFLLWRKTFAGSFERDRFAVIVAAHNEENVIAYFIESALACDYPREKFDVYVVADNCRDLTEKISSAYAVKILKREGDNFSNKAKALNFAIKNIDAQKYDAFCFFDADSLMSKNFLKEMSYFLKMGFSAVQGKQLPKNPKDSWLSRIISVGHFISAAFFQKPKFFLGFSATFHGKGICLKTEIAKKFLWDENCLTEDLEMQMRLIENGIFIAWAENAVVYDEQPVNLNQYFKRTIRWTRGSLDTAKKRLNGLLKRFIKRKDLKALEAFIYCANVYRVSLVGLAAVFIFFNLEKFNFLLWIYHMVPGGELFFKLLFLSPLVLIPFVMLVYEKFSFDMLLAYFLQPVLGILRVPIFIAGVFQDPLKWKVVKHNSRVSIKEIKQKA